MPLHPFAKEMQAHELSGNELTNSEYRPHDGSFATYFRNKQIKLDTQAKEKTNRKSDIFGNCMVYITGYTNPSAQELKRLIVENGGQICAFLGGKSYCTHVIATSLTSRKEVLYANMKVVKPAWVTESVKMGGLLPWSRYRTLHVPGNQTFTANARNETGASPIGETSEPSYNRGTGADDEENTTPNIVDSDVVESIDIGDTASLENDIQPPDILGLPPVGSSEDKAGPIHDGTAVTYEPSLLDVPGAQGDAARKAWILEQRVRVNCLHPTFLKDYFGKSRLHFLSTSKLELRRRCRGYIPPYPERPNSTPRRRTILHIDFDSFFVAVALKKRPSLIHDPVCVSNGSDGSDIASCNYVARQKGVANGQWVAKAKKLCPDLICLPYDFAEYKECSDTLYRTLFSLLPDKITAISVDEAMIDVTHLASARPISDICELIRDKIRNATGINVSVGAGNNILMAKLALKRAKPDGYCVFGDKADIGDFNVRDLPGVGYHIFSQLDQLGVENIASLSKFSLEQLKSTVGNALGQKLFNFAQGIDTDDISSLDVPVRTVGLDIGWGVRVINEMEMLEFIDNCGNELWDRLERSGQVYEILTVKLHIKSPGASFVTPKYMGKGLCDDQSRSQSIAFCSRKDEIISAIHSLVRRIDCAPLTFRGIGLHVKVSDPVVYHDPKQARIAFGTLSNKAPQTPAKRTKFDVESPDNGQDPVLVTPNRKPMVAIPPRKRHRASKTLTQLFVEENEDTLPEVVDAKVLREIPSQIRKEILMNEDDYVVPQDFQRAPTLDKLPSAPMLNEVSFLGTTDTLRIREGIREWVRSYSTPTREDAESFCMFICKSAEESTAWVTTLNLFEWLKTQIKIRSFDGNGSMSGWIILRDYLESELQKKITSRLAK